MNCSFNIRYKPRTTRAFTKSDLTVYDSAGNTALNALTVYGKSEVVDGAIVSAGEGWATVDLGTLEWVYQSDTLYFVSLSLVNIIKPSDYNTPTTALTTAPYLVVARSQLADKRFCVNAFGHIAVMDSDYTDATAFKNSLNGVILAYQLADPTQGNAIAIKTDDGTGIDGTMATFATGTPLYGVSDTARDVMVWNGSAGTVTKNCKQVDLSTLNAYLWTSGGARIENGFGFTLTDRAKTLPDNNTIPNYISTVQLAMLSELINGTKINALSQNTVGTTMYMTIENVDTLQDLQAWFTSNDVIVVYELATPTTTPLTSAENDSIAGLRTFEPQTHAQNNAGAEMTVDYTIRVPTI